MHGNSTDTLVKITGGQFTGYLGTDGALTYVLGDLTVIPNPGRRLVGTLADGSPIDVRPDEVPEQSPVLAFQSFFLGDATHNEVVNLADLSAVRNYFGDFSSMGDANYDGWVNLDDLNEVRNHFGESVPEPAAIALLLVGLAALAVGRYRLRAQHCC